MKFLTIKVKALKQPIPIYAKHWYMQCCL